MGRLQRPSLGPCNFGQLPKTATCQKERSIIMTIRKLWATKGKQAHEKLASYSKDRHNPSESYQVKTYCRSRRTPRGAGSL